MNEKLLQDLFLAYYEARKHKRNTKEAMRFELNFEREIFKLHDEIVSRTYTVSPSTCFIVNNPIRREIFAGAFRDRVVHHLVHGYLNPLCERSFINDSYSCRKGKGTLYGIRRAEHFMRSCTENYTKDAYILKVDIKGYFMSIRKDILYEKVKKMMERYKDIVSGDYDMLVYLVKIIIDNDPTKKYIVHGKRSDWYGLPKSKSLFFSQEGCGLPIGNLTSQLFANIYLNDIDHTIIRKLGFRYYSRYVDDMLFFSRDKKKLIALIPKLSEMLMAEGLLLHPRKIYLQHYTKGVAFLGVYIKTWRTYVGKRIKAGFYRCMIAGGG